MDDVEMGAAPEEGYTGDLMERHHGLQEALVEHGLPHLDVETINGVYGTSRTLRDIIRPRSRRLYRECQHVQPHSLDDVPTVSEDGIESWYEDGKLHRSGDRPAWIYPNLVERWDPESALHERLYPDLIQRWYKHGLLHRDEDLPAEIMADGSQLWFENGLVHRGHGRPAIIWGDGTQVWYEHGKFQKRGPYTPI